MNENMLKLLESSYSLTVNKQEDVVFSCPAVDLLDENKVKQLLDLYTPLIKGLESSVGEAYMTSWFRGPMLGLMYTISAWNKVPDVSLGNLTLQLYKASYNGYEYYTVSFLMENLEPTKGPELEEEYAEWAEEMLSRFFTQTLRPVFETIAKVGTLQVGMLWSQLPGTLQYGYDSLMSSDEGEQVKQRAAQTYALVKSLDGTVFGRSKNPFNIKFRMIESIACSDKQVRMKSACCLYYLIEGADYCFTCPRIKESERESRRAEYREKNPV
ncbi:hypothetical protein BK133_27010 [Paenibacillus sp. FSL H8-0548]|uniref:(2Fe-2S)-binding protein n=1 Tax=Paenibacillus sp. FSL H8-0548 TaxID=1920422 RepID=UPI00096FD784|nr:(2Fe-2S)-binding protein [Paenibacillus sp. FSL H8-0548]OMF22218.1 hypothetical protein BK133_27010 [Paenibacillus sp. FSL H8-0548]